MFKLNDWEVTVEYASLPAIDGNYGMLNYDLGHAIARIQVAREHEAAELHAMAEYNVEKTIIHELIHLRLADCGMTDSDHEERAINALTTAFIELAGSDLEELYAKAEAASKN